MGQQPGITRGALEAQNPVGLLTQALNQVPGASRACCS